jgi:hypothetical protein
MTCERCGQPGAAGQNCQYCGHLIGTQPAPPPPAKKSNKTLFIVLGIVTALGLGTVLVGAAAVVGFMVFRGDDAGSKSAPAPVPTTTAPPVTESPTSEPPVTDPSQTGPSIMTKKMRRNDQAREAAWTSPSGNLWCAIDNNEVWCWAEQHTWELFDFGCTGDWGNSVVLWGNDVDYGCAYDPICISAVPGDNDPCHKGENRMATWWTRPGDPTSQSYGGENAALPYGSTIRIRDLRCTSTKRGMDCQNMATHKGFLISRENLFLR